MNTYVCLCVCLRVCIRACALRASMCAYTYIIRMSSYTHSRLEEKKKKITFVLYVYTYGYTYLPRPKKNDNFLVRVHMGTPPYQKTIPSFQNEN